MFKMKRITSFISRASNLIIASSVAIGIGGIIFFYTFPFNVAEFKKINISQSVEAGGLIDYKLDFCRYVSKGTDIEVKRFMIPKDKSLTNPIELSSNPTLETLDGIIGCRTSEPVKLLTQISTPEGEYRLLIRAEYCIEFTFLRRCIDVEQYSDYFTITKPSIPDRLSVINQELSSINTYIQNNQVPVTGNVQPANPLPNPSNNQSNNNSVNPQVQEPSAPQQPQEEQSGLINPIINSLSKTLDNITNILRL